MTFEEKFNAFIPELTEALTVPDSKDMARKAERDNPLFNNIATYKKWVESLII